MDLVTLLVSLLCLLISGRIVHLYWTQKVGIVESLIYATVFRYYSLRFLGPTVDVLFLVSYAISLHLLFRTQLIHRKTIQLIGFVLVSFCLFFVVQLFGQTNLGGLKIPEILLNNFYFVLKYLLPILIITNFLLLYGEDKVGIFESFKRAAMLSCAVAVLQLLLFILVPNNTVRELVGLTGGDKYFYGVGSLNLVRVQAFCYEPKGLSVILGMALPLFYQARKYLAAFTCFAVGVLTVSQTFYLVVMAFVFVAFFSRLFKRVSAVAFMAILSFFLLFNLVNVVFDQLLGSSSESAFSKVVLNRALERFDVALQEENNDLFGFPLQRDLELPAVNYFKDNKSMLLSGFGPGNYKHVPVKYFVVDWNLELLESGQFKGHFDMGWIFFASEMGLLFAVSLYLLLTGNFVVTDDISRYYAFLIVVFFFHRIDFLLFSFFAVLYFLKKPSVNPPNPALHGKLATA